MRTTINTSKKAAPPYIKAMWMAFGGLFGVLLALTLRPTTASIIRQEADFVFHPTYVQEALSKGHSDLDVSSEYIRRALKQYLIAHPYDPDALMAGIYEGVEESNPERDQLCSRLAEAKLAVLNSDGPWNPSNANAIAAFLLRRLGDRAINPAPNDAMAGVVRKWAEDAAKSEPSNAYFLLYNSAVQRKGDTAQVFIQIAENPENYTVKGYYAEEREAILHGVSKACGGVAEALIRQHIFAGVETAHLYDSLHDKIHAFEKKGDYRSAVAIRQGAIAYGILTDYSDNPNAALERQELFNLALPASGLRKGNDSARAFYFAYLQQHGFEKEALWAKDHLPQDTSTTYYAEWSGDGMVPIYWLGTQWLLIATSLCFALACLVSAVAFRNRYRAGATLSKAKRTSPPLSASAALALIPVLVSIKIQSAMATVPNIALITCVQLAIAVILGGATLALRKKMDLSALFGAFLCSAFFVSLTLTCAMGLFQTIAFVTNIAGGHLPIGYNHQMLFLGCWLATLAPLLAVMGIGGGTSLRLLQRDNLARHYANVFFPACMVFLSLFLFFIVKLDWTANRVPYSKMLEIQRNQPMPIKVSGEPIKL